MNVLLIDDDEQIRRSLRNILTKDDIVITEAGDGEEGLEILRRQPMDLVITDIFMPKKDGFELIGLIRAEYPGIKIIAVSGGGVTGSESVWPLARQLGADECLDKPFRAREIWSLMAKVMGLQEGNNTAEARQSSRSATELDVGRKGQSGVPF